MVIVRFREPDQAIQFTGDNLAGISEFMEDDKIPVVALPSPLKDLYYYALRKSPEHQYEQLDIGDWVIKRFDSGVNNYDLINDQCFNTHYAIEDSTQTQISKEDRSVAADRIGSLDYVSMKELNNRLDR
jgi:hypothetical protein